MRVSRTVRWPALGASLPRAIKWGLIEQYDQLSGDSLHRRD
ncbi:hypothetical protein RB201_01260 [Streptomyces sp. S1A(2023)]